jgi:hypothetical protein
MVTATETPIDSDAIYPIPSLLRGLDKGIAVAGIAE